MAFDSAKKSQEWLKSRGWFSGKVETREYFDGRSKDLFGFVDIIAIHETQGVLFVQACGSDYTDHVKKYAESDIITRRIIRVASARGSRVQIHSWRKEKRKRGGVAYTYVLHLFQAIPQPNGTIVWAELEP